jgi:DNA-binding XRE family transcriptional regulator
MSQKLVLLRRKHALTQLELAHLIGVSQTNTGRLEGDRKGAIHHLRLETAFALQVVFGKSPARLFQPLFDEVEDAVMQRATVLDRSLDGQNDRASVHKRALLSAMVERASARTPTP